jgi:hypothetical protein
MNYVFPAGDQDNESAPWRKKIPGSKGILIHSPKFAAGFTLNSQLLRAKLIAPGTERE